MDEQNIIQTIKKEAALENTSGPPHNFISGCSAAALGVRLLWERARLIHEGKNVTPQPTGTLPEAGTFPAKSLVEKRP